MKIPVLSDLWAKLLGDGVGVIKELVKDKDLAANLEHAFRMKAAESAQTLELKQIDADLEEFRSQQETIRAELHQDDRYTKRTRPKIARQSWYVACFYGVASIVSPLLPVVKQIEFDWEMFIALAAPALTYMGVRAFDKWRGPSRGK